MEEQGLGQMVSRRGPSAEEVQQVVVMLKRGVSPDELIARGVPQELVAMAMQIVQSQAQTQVPADQAGLGNALMAQGRV